MAKTTDVIKAEVAQNVEITDTSFTDLKDLTVEVLNKRSNASTSISKNIKSIKEAIAVFSFSKSNDDPKIYLEQAGELINYIQEFKDKKEIKSRYDLIKALVPYIEIINKLDQDSSPGTNTCQALCAGFCSTTCSNGENQKTGETQGYGYYGTPNASCGKCTGGCTDEGNNHACSGCSDSCDSCEQNCAAGCSKNCVGGAGYCDSCAGCGKGCISSCSDTCASDCSSSCSTSNNAKPDGNSLLSTYFKNI